jgi:hypothetical protein
MMGPRQVDQAALFYEFFRQMLQSADRRRHMDHKIMQALGAEIFGDHCQPELVKRTGLNGIDLPGGAAIDGPARLHVGEALMSASAHAGQIAIRARRRLGRTSASPR